MVRKPNRHGSSWSATDDRKLQTLHRRGVPAADIARALGRSRPAVYQRLSTQKLRRRLIRR